MRFIRSQRSKFLKLIDQQGLKCLTIFKWWGKNVLIWEQINAKSFTEKAKK